jgi:hypothetical protein
MLAALQIHCPSLVQMGPRARGSLRKEIQNGVEKDKSLGTASLLLRRVGLCDYYG